MVTIRHLLYLSVLLLATSACGANLGKSFVIGTTSYLAEVNKGIRTKEKSLDHYTRQERESLEQVANSSHGRY